jgi:hypothetical protein|tara:strand:+ start:232 stop:618 length:387 start_codon:yes stop_codon:yes gene_type:complete
MATSANWTIIFEDKLIIKQSGDAAGTSYDIPDDSFWSDSKFSNIWAIQHGTSITSDEVEYRDETPHSSFADANIGDINQFSSKWDSAHLAKLQSNWDSNNAVDEDGNSTETEAEKIIRLGARPTSYSS